LIAKQKNNKKSIKNTNLALKIQKAL